MNITTRKLSDIRLKSSYLRLNTDVGSLKESIRSVGLLHPLTVNANNELLAGARRFQAVRELGWEEVSVQVADQNELIQELISIDENLVRAPLTSIELEQSLNRGREIFEQLHPTANKVDLSIEPLSTEERAALREREDRDTDSFAAVTSGKTGLSKAVIKSAIKRDELASDAVKKARSDGALDATKTNEIIKLDAELQADVLPLIADKTSKEARRIVAAAKQGGLEAARAEAQTVVPMPREYRQMLSPVRRVNRSMARILVENLNYDGPEREAIHRELVKLWENLEAYLERAGVLEEVPDGEGGGDPADVRDAGANAITGEDAEGGVTARGATG